MDETDGSGHCMYCGVRIDAADTDAECLDPQSAELIDLVINGTGDVPESYPPQIEKAVGLLMENDVRGACQAFSEALEGQDPETAGQLKDSMAECAIRWVFRTVYEGGVYDGGLSLIAPLLTVEDEPSTDVAPLISSVFDGLCQSLTVISTPGDCVNMAKSLFSLVVEYMNVEPRLVEEGEMLDEFIGQCDVLLDLIEQAEPDDGTYAAEIAGLRNTVDLFAEAMYGIVSALPEGAIDGIDEKLNAEGPTSLMSDAASFIVSAMTANNPDDLVRGFEGCIRMRLNSGC